MGRVAQPAGSFEYKFLAIQYSRITKFTGTKLSMVYYLAVLCLSRVFLKASVEQVLYSNMYRYRVYLYSLII